MSAKSITTRNHIPIWVIVGTLSFTVLLYIITLGICATQNIDPPADVLSNLKDVGLVALGALGSMLNRTRYDTALGPVRVTPVNTPETALNVQDTSEVKPV